MVPQVTKKKIHEKKNTLKKKERGAPSGIRTRECSLYMQELMPPLYHSVFSASQVKLEESEDRRVKMQRDHKREVDRLQKEYRQEAKDVRGGGGKWGGGWGGGGEGGGRLGEEGVRVEGDCGRGKRGVERGRILGWDERRGE